MTSLTGMFDITPSIEDMVGRSVSKCEFWNVSSVKKLVGIFSRLVYLGTLVILFYTIYAMAPSAAG